jgi:hypothetical protein
MPAGGRVISTRTCHRSVELRFSSESMAIGGAAFAGGVVV